MGETLKDLVEQTVLGPTPSAVEKFAAVLAERYGDAAQAVLFYGSSLRTGDLTGTLLDFYLIVSSYQSAYKNKLIAFANRCLPPNVYYLEEDIEGVRYRAKYAVLSIDHFTALTRSDCFNVSVWARFSQPSRLAWHAEGARAAVVDAISQAPVTLLKVAHALLPSPSTPRDLWTKAFALTYACELRAERASKGLELYDLAPGYYELLTRPVLEAAGISVGEEGGKIYLPTVGPEACRKAHFAWRLRSLQGKILTLLRLIKASFTFDGGLDYLAWKIERHSAVPIVIKPWHRRWPILGGLVLFMQLRRRGAVR